MMRSQTDEQLAARWDPEPYLSTDGTRSAFLPNGTAHRYRFDPRVECIPSRDVPGMIDAVRCDDGTWDQVELYEGAFEDAGDQSRPPVNPILVRFRAEEDADHNGAMVYLDLFDKVKTDMLRYRWKAEGWDSNFGQEAVDHARKVLTRLAALA